MPFSKARINLEGRKGLWKSKAGINKLTTSPWSDIWKAMVAIWRRGIKVSYDTLQQIVMSILLCRLDRRQIS